MNQQKLKYETVDKMMNYGGSFVRLLGQLWQVADESNQTKLEETFSEYFDKYEKMAKIKND